MCARQIGGSFQPDTKFNGEIDWPVRVLVRASKSHFDEGRTYAGSGTCSEHRPGCDIGFYADVNLLNLLYITISVI
jgi:hypothetical protein